MDKDGSSIRVWTTLARAIGYAIIRCVLLQNMGDRVTAIINGYKRAANVDLIVMSLLNQTMPPSEIFIWWNDRLEFCKSKMAKYCQNVVSDKNMGVWARFTFALNAETEYVVIFDDDTIPGHKWIENCMEHSHLGLLGTIGLIYTDRLHYMNHIRYGWANPNAKPVKVDIVGHSWFFRREWLSTYFAELPPPKGFRYFGEDIHFSYVLQKYRSIDTYVPPHPVEDWQLWGSINGWLGTDEHAISMEKDAGQKWDKPFHHYLGKGFVLINGS